MSSVNEQREYLDDVAQTAQSIKDELYEHVKDGACGESLCEWLTESLNETIDGSARIIYTRKAKMCVVYSDNDSAYFDEFGAEGAADETGIKWEKIAYCAFRADVFEELGRIGVDVNNPMPECEDCGTTDQYVRKLIGDNWLCEACARLARRTTLKKRRN